GTGLAATDGVGTYFNCVTIANATGGTFSPNNYNITYVSGNIIVNAAQLTITANDVNKTYGTTLTSGPGSTAFTTTGLQNSETIGSVSIGYGTGSAAADGTGTYINCVTIANATGGTFSSNNYNITYVPGNIIVGYFATITTTGSLSPLNTVYGMASASISFTVSGTNMNSGILVTPSAGFEVSTDNTTFNSTVNVGAAGTFTQVTIYIRLAATSPVGNYSGNILLNSSGIADVYVTMPVSTVTAALLTITADNKSKTYRDINPILTLTYVGFVNNDSPAQLTAQPIVTTTAVTTSPVGQYPITASGAGSTNYTFNYISGLLTIYPAVQVPVIPNAFTPNGDGINDTWIIKYLDYYPNCTVEIFNRYGQNVYYSNSYGIPWDGTYKGGVLPTGTYYYIINLKNGLKVLSGYVALIR
ncbi:MBG domain-containing protein, partial [Mucilaginibacter sp.]